MGIGRVMRILICALAFTLGCQTAAPVTLALEKRTTLRVGDTAVLHVPDDGRYAHFQARTQPALALVRQTDGTVVYRATQVGQAVIVISPDVPDGACISCATLHYFIDVVDDD
jgi:hypothetical protein